MSRGGALYSVPLGRCFDANELRLGDFDRLAPAARCVTIRNGRISSRSGESSLLPFIGAALAVLVRVTPRCAVSLWLLDLAMAERQGPSGFELSLCVIPDPDSLPARASTTASSAPRLHLLLSHDS